MSPNMDWEKWSGFKGEGTYLIINLSNLHSLNLDAVGDAITTEQVNAFAYYTAAETHTEQPSHPNQPGSTVAHP